MTTWPKIPIDTSVGWDMCFACGEKNPIGLKLKFTWDGKTARAEFTPNKNHQGWSGIVHGGLLTTLLDEAMGYACIFQGIFCVTAKMQARWRRPAVIGEPLIITASVTKNARKLLEAKAAISLKDGTAVAEATATLFVLNQEQNEASNEEEN
jgi:uncharacterized protein (TIGR00369 family)